MTTRSVRDLEKISKQIRWEIIKKSHKAQTPHLGSSLSCVDLLVALYWSILNVDPKNPLCSSRDRFILSKGHAGLALYEILALRGFFPPKLLDSYAQEGSSLSEHPGPNCVPGVEAATGALGHGLSIGLGMSLAAKIREEFWKTFVLMSDGECNEGSVWEAAMMAPIYELNNLIAVIDFNKWQATGRSVEIMALEPLRKKWDSFGWYVSEIDGHCFSDILQALEKSLQSSSKPTVIVAHTIKGKGVSFMEDDNNWHYRIPTKEDLSLAKKELGVARR